MSTSSHSARFGALFLFSLSLLAAGPLRAATPVYQWSTLVGRGSTGSEDGTGDKARFNQPNGIAADPTGNLYVADKGNHTIRKIAPGGIVTTLAGSPGQAGSADGVGAAARFNSPQGIAVDSSGNILVADTGNHTIRKISTTGAVTTLAGVAGAAAIVDGPVAAALFSSPMQIGADGAGIIYILDGGGIRRIMNGQVETIYQGGGTLTVPIDYYGRTTTATVAWISGLAVASDGQVYFTVGLGVYNSAVNTTDSYPGLFKRTAVGEVSMMAGGPQAYSGNLIRFNQLAVDGSGNIAILAASQWEGVANPILRFKVDGTVIDGGTGIYRANGADIAAHGIALAPTGELFYARDDNAIFRRSGTGPDVLTAGVSSDVQPFPAAWSLAVDPTGSIWVAGEEYKVQFGRGSDGVSLKKFASDGTLTTVIAPQFVYELYGNSLPLVTADGSRGMCFLHGMFSQTTLTRVAPNGTITDTPMGLKQPGASPSSNYFAMGFVADASGNLIVPDSLGHAIWRSASDGTWTVLAGKDGESGTADGTGGTARFDSFQAITADRSGNFYVLDSSSSSTGSPVNSVIRKITSLGVVTTVSSNLVQASPVSGSPVQPIGLAIDSKGVFYLAYPGLNSVWRWEPGGTMVAIGGAAGSPGEVDGTSSTARFRAPGGIAIDAQDRLVVLDSGIGSLRRGLPLFGPAITTQPQSMSVATGGAAQFSVVATGTPDPTYQWNFNGSAIAGATGASYSISGAQASNAGNYTVTVTNSQGSVTSGTATLTVTASGGGGGNGGGSSGGGGGGGAPGIWFYAALAVATFLRFRWQGGGGGHLSDAPR